jgi:peptide/nickel transport system permease protein
MSAPPPPPVSPGARVAGALPRRLRLPLLFVGLLVAVALAAPLLAPHAPRVPDDVVALRNLAPRADHPFGTDQLGRDVLSLVLHGARVSLAFAVGSVLVSLTLGTGYGALAALRGGLADRLLMRALDVALALPRLLLLLAVTAFWGPLPLPALVALVGATGWFDIARLVRGDVQALLTRDFVLAARALGVPTPRLFARHVAPHLLPTLAVTATLGVAHTIALEAGLSYLGLGIQPPLASWGTILSDGAGVVDAQWWLTAFPGLATVIAVLACNALGDALRDTFAPAQVGA